MFYCHILYTYVVGFVLKFKAQLHCYPPPPPPSPAHGGSAPPRGGGRKGGGGKRVNSIPGCAVCDSGGDIVTREDARAHQAEFHPELHTEEHAARRGEEVAAERRVGKMAVSVCEECGGEVATAPSGIISAATVNRGNMKLHLASHAPAGAHPCPHAGCGVAAFTRKGGLDRHIQTAHTAPADRDPKWWHPCTAPGLEPPCPCASLEGSFPKAEHARAHELTAHNYGEWPECGVCKRKFDRKDNRDRHQKNCKG